MPTPSSGKAQDGGTPSKLPMDDDLREAHFQYFLPPGFVTWIIPKPEPRHFRFLRWLGWECKIHP